jgi:hypothetical protein
LCKIKKIIVASATLLLLLCAIAQTDAETEIIKLEYKQREAFLKSISLPCIKPTN